MDEGGRLRVAHLGCGAWGSNLVREMAAHPHAVVTTVIDPDVQARERARHLVPHATIASSVQALESQPVDAVVIATPGPLHAEHAMMALAAGADVFVEKPMTTSVADARMLVARCRASGRIGMVGHLLHHHAAVRAMLAAVRAGRIGAPRSFRSARYCKRGSRDADGSLLWSLAPHDMSVLRALDPSNVEHLRVQLQRVGSAEDPSRIGAANQATLHLRMQSGLEACVTVSRAHAAKVRRMELVGEEATLVFDDLAEAKLTLRSRDRIEVIEHDGSVTPLRAEVAAFVECARHRAQPRIGFVEGLEVVELLERAHAVAVWTGSVRPEPVGRMTHGMP